MARIPGQASDFHGRRKAGTAPKNRWAAQPVTRMESPSAGNGNIFRRITDMANAAIVGINWGDEGKGRMVDLLTENYDIVIRYQGGGNAGHTVICILRQAFVCLA